MCIDIGVKTLDNAMVTLFKGKMYRAKFVELGMKKFQLQHGSIPVGIAFVGILESYFSP